MLAPLAKSGFSFTMSPVSGTLSPQPDGRWLVGYSGDYDFVYSAPGVDGNLQILGMRSWRSSTRPLLRSSRGRATSAGSPASRRTAGPGLDAVLARNERHHSDVTAVPKDPGAVTTTAHQTSGGTVVHVYGRMPAIDASMDSSTADVTLDGARNRALLN